MVRKMLNGHVLLKRVADVEGELSFASALDSSMFKGEVVDGDGIIAGSIVFFLKGSGEDIDIDGEKFKVVHYTDLIMTI
jgi:hypothetical protein